MDQSYGSHDKNTTKLDIKKSELERFEDRHFKMMKSWSHIVLILSVFAVVSPVPAPQYDLFGSANLVNPLRVYSEYVNGAAAFQPEPVNPNNPTNTPKSALVGASNILASGLRDTGAMLGNAISRALSTVTHTFGTFLSGILGDGMVNDAKYETFLTQPSGLGSSTDEQRERDSFYVFSVSVYKTVDCQNTPDFWPIYLLFHFFFSQLKYNFGLFRRYGPMFIPWYNQTVP